MLSKLLGGRATFLRMFSGAVAVQAMLSASSFAVGLLLVRRTSDAQYGYYVLITVTVLLLTSVQWSFISPPMIIRMSRSNQTERADLIGGLYRDQTRLLPVLGLFAAILAVVLWINGKLDLQLAATLVCGTLATIAALHRDFLRSILFAYRRPNDVLRSDSLYCVLLVAGAFAATFTSIPSAAAALTLALACFAGSRMLSAAIWRHEPWNPKAPLGMLREIAPVGALSAVGSGVHLLYSQGYNYLVAGTLDIKAVAALAATRLLVMPVNLLSTGVGTLMLPTVSRWLQHSTRPRVFWRLALVSAGLAGLACSYLLIMWFARSWVFADLLKKQFSARDGLLLMWSTIAIVMIFRDQLLHYLVARARFGTTSSMTTVSAVIAVSISLIAMRRIGVIGALLGLLVGELTTVFGIIVFSLRDAHSKDSVQTIPASEPQLDERA
jgi:O-antigen/teichoic acid export membrane protein